MLPRLLATFSAILLATTTGYAVDRPRLFVLTDIGGDPDDQQSMVRLMVYTNEFEIEGLVASASGTPGELKESITQPQLIRNIVTAYGQVRPRLLLHAEGWPAAEALAERIKSGNPHRGTEYIGETHDTEGSLWLINRVDAGTPERPLNVTIWGGQTDLAQALWRVKHDRGTEGYQQFIQRLRVFDIDDQDRIASWIRTEFPGLYYILGKAPAGAIGAKESIAASIWAVTKR